MPFYVFAWITNFFYSLSAITGKLTSKHQIKNPWQLNYLWGLFSCILITPFALWNGVHLPTHWGPLWVFGIASALSGTLWILSMSLLDVSVLTPLYAFRPVFSVILGLLFLNEHLTVTQYILIGVIIIAGLFESADDHFSLRSFFHPTIALAITAVLFSAILGAATKYAMTYEGLWEVTLWGSLLSMVPGIVTIPLFWKDVQRTPVQKYKGLIVSVVISFIGFLSVNKAFAENISITTAILSVPTSMLMAFLFSVFAPKLLEKHSMKIYAIRFSAAAVMVLAALKLTS
jgi:drug/metabolite transporter (DMT)-like permease